MSLFSVKSPKLQPYLPTSLDNAINFIKKMKPVGQLTPKVVQSNSEEILACST